MLQPFPTVQNICHWVKTSHRTWGAKLNVGAIALGLAVSLVASLITTTTAQAAERISFWYGLYELTVTRQELETFATTGTVEGGLKTLLARLSPNVQAQLQTTLQAHYDLDPVLANRFAYTRSGEQLLTAVGELIQTDARLNGSRGLRSALTLAAADPEGLTLLNFLAYFPTDIRIDISQALATAEALKTLLDQTQQVIDTLTEETNQLATTEPPIDFTALPDPRQPGAWQPVRQTLELYDQTRDRTISIDVYTPAARPKQATTLPQNMPVIVVSNGLGARRDRFKELAQHLASHGFAVALPDHPGSDRERLLDFYQGLEAENFEPTEYIDRPLDVSFVLDELTRLNKERFGNRLDPTRAGVFGYSFGGTTALALAGAEIDLDHLQRACDTRSSIFNISLLYQCRALDLPATSIDLRDERVQAVYVFVPFSRSLYGPEGIAQVEGPVLWEATDKDILTPFLIEQMPAYSWLTRNDANVAPDQRPERYLVVTAGLPHARITLEVLNRLTGQQQNWEEIRSVAENYHQMLNLVFFQVHLANNAAYRPYLQPRGAQALTQEPYGLTWQNTPLEAQFLDD